MGNTINRITNNYWHMYDPRVLVLVSLEEAWVGLFRVRSFGFYSLPRGSLVVPFWDYRIGSELEAAQRNYYGAYG